MTRPKLGLVLRVAQALAWDLDNKQLTKRLLAARWRRKTPGVQDVYLDCAETHLRALRAVGLSVSVVNPKPRKARR